MADVFVHLGLPKTGTSSIQAALDHSVAALADHGVDFVCGSHHEQRRAVYDLLGRRIPGDERSVYAGSWKEMVTTIDASTANVIVVSDENLVLARPRHVRRLASDLSAHRIFPVVTLRDLGRVLVSAWQQDVLGGHSFTWDEYVRAAQDPASGPATAGVVLQLRFDVVRCLDMWERVVPRDRVRLVTVPPAGSPANVLLDRFGEVLGVPSGVLRGQDTSHNASLGAVEVEALRRLNRAVGSELDVNSQAALLKRGARAARSNREARPLRLPEEERRWVADRTQAVVDELHARNYRVVGDLADLDLRPAEPNARRLDEVTTEELLAATEEFLRSLSVDYGQLWKRHQRLKGRQEADASLPTRLSSSARAATFRARAAALDGADHNRFLAWLARRYVGRPSTR